MRRVMLVGSIGCGKTTLTQRLQNKDLVHTKTQTVYLEDDIYDTPGEYLDHGGFKHALLLTSFDSDLVVFLQSATAGESKFPPGFATYFTRPVMGVVTKTDIAEAGAVEHARNLLTLAGVQQIRQVSSITGEGIQDLAASLSTDPDDDQDKER